jgi:hypothetical protein
MPIGATWELTTKDGTINLDRDDLVGKNPDGTFYLFKKGIDYRKDKK